MWRSSKTEIVIVDVLDARQRFDDANHRQVGQSKQVLTLKDKRRNMESSGVYVHSWTINSLNQGQISIRLGHNLDQA